MGVASSQRVWWSAGGWVSDACGCALFCQAERSQVPACRIVAVLIKVFKIESHLEEHELVTLKSGSELKPRPQHRAMKFRLMRWAARRARTYQG